MIWVSYLIIFTLSCSLTWALRCFALATKRLDIPNHRSSHVAPTPKGGGISFVLSFLFSVIFLWAYKLISLPLAVALLGGGSLTALIGFLDDQYGIPVRWRLVGHFAVSGFVLYSLGGMPTISILSWTVSSGLIANALAILYLVWLLNLYNFMDGIDGIAAVEAIAVCLGGIVLYGLASADKSLIILSIFLAVAVAGFLFWNFPPAKIFMGDVGSGFLGLVLGILSIQAAIVKANFFWAWMILLGIFIVDATVTLLFRGMRGEVIFEAHCNHAYQHASRYFGNHLSVTLSVVLINLLWLLPMAMIVGFELINGCLGVLIAYLPLLLLALKFKAGRKE